MKRDNVLPVAAITLIATIVCIIYLVSINRNVNSISRGGKSKSDTPNITDPNKNDHGGVGVPPPVFLDEPPAGGYGTIVAKSAAITTEIGDFRSNEDAMVVDDVTAPGSRIAPSSFLFPATGLQNYLTDLKSSGYQYVHLILGESAAAKSTSLYICGILEGDYNTPGKHCYINRTNPEILKCTTDNFPFVLGNPPTDFKLGSANIITAKGSNIGKKLMSKDNALACHKKYFNNIGNNAQKKVKTATSFIVELDLLKTYVDDVLAQPNLTNQNIEFFLGQDYGKLTIMIGARATSAGASKYLFLSVDGVSYLLEHCHPCPTCEPFSDVLE